MSEVNAEGLPPLSMSTCLLPGVYAYTAEQVRQAQREAFDLGRTEGRRDQHETHVVLLGENCKLRAELARRAAVSTTSDAVAWAVTAERGGIHKLAITRESAERKAAKWREEWPNNNCQVRPLVFGAPQSSTNSREQTNAIDE